MAKDHGTATGGGCPHTSKHDEAAAAAIPGTMMTGQAHVCVVCDDCGETVSEYYC